MASVKPNPKRSSVEVTETGLQITDLEIEYPEVKDYFKAMKAGDREAEFIRVVRIGVVALRRALGANELEFVKSEVLRLLSPESKFGSTIENLGKVVDPDYEYSIQSAFETALTDAVDEITGEEGLMGRVVQALMESQEFLNLQNQMDEVYRKVLGKEGEKRTTKAGTPFEEEVYELLNATFGQSGCSVEWTGPDNKIGDVLLTFEDERVPFSIIVEAKNHTTRNYGKTTAREDADGAIRRRGARAAVIVVPDASAFTKEMGDWREGSSSAGPWIATTLELVCLAVRVSRIQEHRKLNVRIDVDVDRAAERLEAIKSQLQELTTAKSRITDSRASAKLAWEAIDDMQKSIVRAVKQLEEALQIEESKTDTQDLLSKLEKETLEA